MNPNESDYHEAEILLRAEMGCQPSPKRIAERAQELADERETMDDADYTSYLEDMREADDYLNGDCHHAR